MRNLLQHYFNPMHVYCRLRGIGFSGPAARRWAGAWENTYQRILSEQGGKMFEWLVYITIALLQGALLFGAGWWLGRL